MLEEKHKTDGTPCWCNPKVIKVAPKELQDRLVFVGRDGFPVEGFIGKPIKTFIRRLFLTKKVMKYQDWLENGGCKIQF